MAADHHPAGQTLGLRGAHVVGLELVDRLRVHEPHDDRGERRRHDEARHEHRLEELPQVVARVLVVARVEEERHVEGAEAGLEQQQQPEAEQVRGHRVEDSPSVSTVRVATERGLDAQKTAAATPVGMAMISAPTSRLTSAIQLRAHSFSTGGQPGYEHAIPKSRWKKTPPSRSPSIA